MKRGVIQITDQELQEFETIAGLNPQLPLYQKLAAAKSDDQIQSSIEMSAAEAEMMMDALPAPGENPTLDSLRAKVSEFYHQLK